MQNEQTIEADRQAHTSDQTLRRFVGYRLKRAYNTLRGDLLTRLEPLGLRITTYSALVLICDHPGLRQSAVANALDVKRSNMVVIVDDLERKGWISRQQVPTDRRAHALYPTLSGKRVCEKAIALDTKHESQLLKCLTADELKKLSMLLEKIELSSAQ